MDTALIVIRSEAPRLLLFMMVPAGLIFFGTFFTAITMERRRHETQRPIRAILGSLERAKNTPSRYAYAIEQQERAPLIYQQIPAHLFSRTRSLVAQIIVVHYRSPAARSL